MDKGQHDFCFLSRTSFKRTDYISDSLLATLDFETVGRANTTQQNDTLLQVKMESNELRPILAVVCTEDQPDKPQSFWTDKDGGAAEKMLKYLFDWARRFPYHKKIVLAHKSVAFAAAAGAH